jgi:putative addiction module killer protein
MIPKDIEVVQFQTEAGASPFGEWFGALDGRAAAKVRTAIVRMELRNLADTKPVGDGVLERRIDWGPGYRIYFGRDGDDLIVLLGGGTKKRQQSDISRAKACWAEYRRRKKER